MAGKHETPKIARRRHRMASRQADTETDEISADEPRRSGRATKGQNKALDEAETAPKSKKAAKAKTTKKAAPVEDAAQDDDGEDDEETIRCVCGDNSDDEAGRKFVACDSCEMWQHNICMGVPLEEEAQPEHYFCEQCRPEEHKELLEAIKRGEKIWEERQKAAKAKKKAPKRGRKSMKGSRNSEIKQDTLDEAKDADEHATEDSPSQESGVKRKYEDDANDGAHESDHPPSKPSRADKRRKSAKDAAAQDPETAVVPMSRLPDDRQKVAKSIAAALKTGINAKSKAGTFRIPDGETADSLSEHFATLIEYELYQNHGAKGKGLSDAYRIQFMAINANVKKNPALADRIIKKTLSPAELAVMATQDMASEELQREREKMKEEADKQAVMLREDDKPRMRRTHKGDEYVDDSANAQQESVFTSKPVRRRESEIDGDGAGSPTATSPVTATQPESDRRKSSTFDINNVWAQTAASPDTETAGARTFSPSQPPVSANNTPAPPKATGDADIDRLLADDDDAYTPAESETIWRGTLNQPQVASLTVSARFVAGNDFSQFMPWTSFLPSQLEIEGRLDRPKADDYLCGLQWSKRSDVTVLALSPHDNKPAFDTIFEYFHSRGKYAVGAKRFGISELVKDLYLTPVDVGDAAPPHIDLLDFNALAFPATERALLATFVVNKPAAWDDPVQHGIPPNPYAAQETYTFPAEAAKILGAWVDAPVARQILAATKGVVQINEAMNMRSLFERDAQAAQDMQVFARALQAGQGQ